uniref:MAM domain-containing protein n=1 Tax=Plectus sambesii TaxID=2011161 RepID=A0A914X4I9_9BILA
MSVRLALLLIFILTSSINSSPVSTSRDEELEPRDIADLSELCDTTNLELNSTDLESKNDTFSEDKNTTVTLKSRSKRSTLLNSKWPEGIIPFRFGEHFNWCGWRQQMSNLMPAYYKDSGESVPKWKADADQFDWLRFRNKTPSVETGPTSDASGKGHYIYAESSFPRSAGDIARISTPSFTAKKDHKQLCLSFQYHSYTTADKSDRLSQLNVYLLATSDAGKVRQRKLFKTMDKDMKNEWQTVKVSIDLKKKVVGSALNIVFEVVMGNSYIHDIAIDDYKLSFLSSTEKC